MCPQRTTEATASTRSVVGVAVAAVPAMVVAVFSAMHYGTKPDHFETSTIHFPTSEEVSKVSERANERMDKRVAQYLRLDSWLF